jgi:hypothetical protein
MADATLVGLFFSYEQLIECGVRRERYTEFQAWIDASL